MTRGSLTGWICFCLAATSSILFAQEKANQPVEMPVQAATPEAVSVPLPIELRPYKIRILLADADGDITSLSQELAQALARSVGQLWQTEIAPLEGLSRIDGEALRRWTVDRVQPQFSADDADIWFAVTICRQGTQSRLAVRAWQPRFDWLSPVHDAAYYEPRETAGRIVQLCWGLFRPQILIEDVDKTAARIRIPGGDLRPADPEFALLRPGDCLVPWLFYYDREKTLKRRQELPWTYVRLDTIEGPLGTGTILSGLRSSLGGKTRGRIEKVAVVAKAVYPNSRLQLSVQNQPSRLLSGYRLELRPKLPTKQPVAEKPAAGGAAAEPVEPEQVIKLLTDRIGEVLLTPPFAHPLTWLYIYSGDLMLARVPFVIGSHASLRLEVPDDSVRLRVEGDLQALESELINLVAQQNTLIATIRSTAKQGKPDRMTELRQQLDKLPTHDTFVKKLAAIRVLSTQEAQARKDRSGEVRIAKLCNNVEDLINRYLDPEKLRLVKEELDEVLKLAKDAAQSQEPAADSSPQ